MRKERGFTLIELLIVLAILGILVGIVAMSVGGLTDTAKERGMRSELDIVQTAIDTYNTQDVLVGSGTAIDGVTDASDQIEAGDTGFQQYLRRDTQYFFGYLDDGESLLVCDTADEALQMLDAGGEVTADEAEAVSLEAVDDDAMCFPNP
jgi:prepilin-type N-terminal cleavage/methylation domain-containing protein